MKDENIGITRRTVLTAAAGVSAIGLAGQVSAQTQPPVRELYVLDHDSLNPADQMLAQSIQGITSAQESGVWLSGRGIIGIIEGEFRGDGIRVRRANNVFDLVRQFKSVIAGAVVYKLGTPSVNVATSICGGMKAVAIDESLLDQAKTAGLSLLVDVRDMNEAEAYVKYRRLFSHGILVEQPVDKPGHLRDFAIAHRAFTFFTHDSAFRHKVITDLGPNAIVYGWGPDEFGWISDLSAAQSTAGPADWSTNLSMLERLAVTGIKRPFRTSLPKEDGVKYIAFVLSDGDNLQWLGGGFATSEAFWASPLRGTFPMTWEVSTLLSKVGPRVLRYLYRHATQNDGFVAGAGVPGYTYPHLQPDRFALAQQAAPMLAEADLSIASVLNTNSGSLSETAPILDLPHIKGVIYKDYAPYNRSQGRVFWHNGKPCVSYRYLLWEGLQEPAEVARRFALQPATPLKDVSSYALVQAHAWSYGKTGGPLEAIRRTIELLPPNTRVVTADQLVELMARNLGNR